MREGHWPQGAAYYYIGSNNVQKTSNAGYSEHTACRFTAARYGSIIKKYTLGRLRVTYNNIMRRLMGLPTWCSASFMSVNLNVNSFQEVLQLVIYRLVTIIEESYNRTMYIVRNSDAYVKYSLRKEYRNCL